MRALRVGGAARAGPGAGAGRGGGGGGGGGGAHAERPGLVYYESYDPRSLDPALSTDVPTGEMVTLAYDGLTQFDADGRLLPALAARWTASPDGQRYVFPVRPGVRSSY